MTDPLNIIFDDFSIWWLSHSAVYTCIFHRGIIW